MTHSSSRAENILNLQVVRDPENVPKDHPLRGPVRLAHFLLGKAAETKPDMILSAIAAGNLSVRVTVGEDAAPSLVALLSVMSRNVKVGIWNGQEKRAGVHFQRGERPVKPSLASMAYIEHGTVITGQYDRLDNQLPSYDELLAHTMPGLKTLFDTAVLLDGYAQQLADTPSQEQSVTAGPIIQAE